MEETVLPIEKSVETTNNYPTVTERYFTKYYFVPQKKYPNGNVETLSDIDNRVIQSKNDKHKEKDMIDEATCVMMHSNKLCVIVLPNKHPILKYQKKIKKVCFIYKYTLVVR